MKNKSSSNWPSQEELKKGVTKVTDKNLAELPKEVQHIISRHQAEGEAVFLTEKYYKGLKSITERDLKIILKKSPDTPIKELVAQLIGSLPDFIPADKVLEVTAFIIRSWEKWQIKLRVAA